jgi:hypothetical protein
LARFHRLRAPNRRGETGRGTIICRARSLSIAESGREDIRVMLIGALGCNLAWGIIDGIRYLMGALAEQSQSLLTLRAVREAKDPAKARLFVADREWLHLEARFNYEDRETGSLWIGYNFSGGETVEWELTPILGGVFGNTTGIAPGYEGSLSWRMLEFYSEGEYVITDDSSERFLYNWSELTLAPAEWFRFGLVTQRTRAYQTNRDIQRGLLVGFSYKQADFTTCLFNPDDEKPTFVMAVGVNF